LFNAGQRVQFIVYRDVVWAKVAAITLAGRQRRARRREIAGGAPELCIGIAPPDFREAAIAESRDRKLTLATRQHVAVSKNDGEV
jgi:hypothetical protein